VQMCDSHGSPLPLDGQLCWSLQLPILLQFLVVALAWLSIRLLHGCTSHTSTHAHGGYFECPSELWAANSRSWFCLFPLWFVIPCRSYPGSTQASERTGLLFTFIISVAIFLALSCLMGWHVYLVFTAQVREVAPKDSTRVSRPAECSRLLCSPLQTTIEFYNNQRERQVQRAKGAVIRVRAYVRALTMHSFIHAACAQVDSG